MITPWCYLIHLLAVYSQRLEASSFQCFSLNIFYVYLVSNAFFFSLIKSFIQAKLNYEMCLLIKHYEREAVISICGVLSICRHALLKILLFGHCHWSLHWELLSNIALRIRKDSNSKLLRIWTRSLKNTKEGTPCSYS